MKWPLSCKLALCEISVFTLTIYTRLLASKQPIGMERYDMSDIEKDAAKVGAVGAAAGAAGSVSTVAAVGAVGGLGAAGITSGLATVGSVVGGGMAAGLAVTAAAPIAIGAAAYGLYKWWKS
jgi:hypothetical protein